VSVIESLLAVQECDARIREIERELKDIPARKKEEESRLESHQAALLQAQEALKARQSELKQIELDGQSKEDQITRFRQQQLQLKTNKEFKAMDQEIATVQKAIRELEDRELVLMEGIERAKADVAAREAELDGERSAISEDLAVLNERMAGLEAEVASIRTRRAEAAKAVDDEWLSPYEIIAARRFPALVEISDGVCSGCHMKLPPQVSHDVKRRESTVSCPFCGRLLH